MQALSAHSAYHNRHSRTELIVSIHNDASGHNNRAIQCQPPLDDCGQAWQGFAVTWYAVHPNQLMYESRSPIWNRVASGFLLLYFQGYRGLTGTLAQPPSSCQPESQPEQLKAFLPWLSHRPPCLHGLACQPQNGSASLHPSPDQPGTQ